MAKFVTIVTAAWSEVKDLAREAGADNKKEIKDAVNKVSKAVSKGVKKFKKDLKNDEA